jgi:nicotinate-nucleotide adenylyltransferase
MKRLAFYGGSFDPVHNGHLAIARAVIEGFGVDEFVFIPAFHAPHKSRMKPTSPYDRYSMLCLTTQDLTSIRVSKIEVEAPDAPYSVETLAKLDQLYPDDELYFVMGADSWMDIRTWREWEKVLSLTNHIVVTRPGIEIDTDHVTPEVRERVVDLRGSKFGPASGGDKNIYLTDLVNADISATSIRHRVRGGENTWRLDVPREVAIYIEKYQIYT